MTSTGIPGPKPELLHNGIVLLQFLGLQEATTCFNATGVTGRHASATQKAVEPAGTGRAERVLPASLMHGDPWSPEASVRVAARGRPRKDAEGKAVSLPAGAQRGGLRRGGDDDGDDAEGGQRGCHRGGRVERAADRGRGRGCLHLQGQIEERDSQKDLEKVVLVLLSQALLNFCLRLLAWSLFLNYDY